MATKSPDKPLRFLRERAATVAKLREFRDCFAAGTPLRLRAHDALTEAEAQLSAAVDALAGAPVDITPKKFISEIQYRDAGELRRALLKHAAAEGLRRE